VEDQYGFDVEPWVAAWSETSEFYILRDTNQPYMNGCWALAPIDMLDCINNLGFINTEKGSYEGTSEVDYTFKSAEDGNNYTAGSIDANCSTWSSGSWDWGWLSKNWVITSATSMYLPVDNFASTTYANIGGTRYIYQCQGSQASPTDPNQLQYKPSNDGWWDTDGNGYCAKLSYNNVLNGIAGLGIKLSSIGAAMDISQYHGIIFWACSDYGSDYGLGPLAEVQIPSGNIGNNGWLGNYWHCEFYLTYNWQKYDLNFSRFSVPVNNTTLSFTTCLQQALGIEFQQGITDNRASKNLQGNIYIDDIELYK
jgi:hypothetical protein